MDHILLYRALIHLRLLLVHMHPQQPLQSFRKMRFNNLRVRYRHQLLVIPDSSKICHRWKSHPPTQNSFSQKRWEDAPKWRASCTHKHGLATSVMLRLLLRFSSYSCTIDCLDIRLFFRCLSMLLARCVLIHLVVIRLSPALVMVRGFQLLQRGT